MTRGITALCGALLLSGAVHAAPADPLQQPAQVSRLAVSSPLFAVATAGPRLVAVGQRGHILVSEDEGRHWEQAAVPVSVDLTAVHFASAQRGWATGHDGVILATADGGRHWVRQLDGRQAAALIVERYGKQVQGGSAELKAIVTEAQRMLAEGPDLPFLDVWFDDERTGYAVGAFNLLFTTSDGGATWLPASDRVDNPQAHHLYAIQGHGGDLYIAGELGLLLRLDRASQRFTAVPSPYKGTWFGLVVKPDLVIAHGLRGNAWRSRDGGRSWQQVRTPVQTGLTGSAVLGDGRIALVSQDGRVMLSADNGGSFESVPSAKPTPLYGVAPSGNGGLALVGARGVRVEAVK
ncbi:MAG TPA: YCF48-related protein [Burkholderiaceae bacterium]